MKRNRVNSNDIKLEENFLDILIRQIDYNNDSINMTTCNGTIRDNANRFSEKYNISYKQLMQQETEAIGLILNDSDIVIDDTALSVSA